MTPISEFAIVSSSPVDTQACVDALADYPEELHLTSEWQDGALRLATAATGADAGDAEMLLIRSRRVSQAADLARFLDTRPLAPEVAHASGPLWFTDVMARGWDEERAAAITTAIAARMSGRAYRR